MNKILIDKDKWDNLKQLYDEHKSLQRVYLSDCYYEIQGALLNRIWLVIESVCEDQEEKL